MDLINQTELRVIGMSRSGNHPIIDWIRRQAGGRVCFLNCAEPQSGPFDSCRPLASGRRAIVNYRPFRLREERRGKFSRKDWLIFSHEDCFLSTIGRGYFEERHDELVGRSQRRVNVLILRDPYNLFASRLQSNFGGVTSRTAVRIWTQHARQFLGERNHFSGPTVAISYNHWSTDQDYRQSVAEKLGLGFTDRGFRHVPTTGGGSSFDGLRFKRKAAEMPTLERWRRFRNDSEYRQLFNENIVHLADEIFHLPSRLRNFASSLRGTARV